MENVTWIQTTLESSSCWSRPGVRRDGSEQERLKGEGKRKNCFCDINKYVRTIPQIIYSFIYQVSL